MKPYQPSLAAPVKGLLILLLAVLLGGAVFGVLVSLLSNLIYVIILFPIGMGWLGGKLVAAAVRAGKIRNPGVAIGAGILIAVVMYGAMWAGDYYQFRNAQATDPSNASTQAGRLGSTGFILAEDQSGAAVLELPALGTKVLNLGPVLSWAAWLVEVLLIAWLAVGIGRKPAYQPFCEACNRWHGAEQLLGTLGSKRSKEVTGFIESAQFLKLGEELQTNPSLPNVGVFLAQCGPGCAEGDAFLAVRSQVRGSGGKAIATDLLTGMISPAQTQEILRGIENRKALYGL